MVDKKAQIKIKLARVGQTKIHEGHNW